MNLEHCRKDAKRLLRDVAAQDPDALARVGGVLGDRIRWRFGLSDAQHVVAVERGYRSWPALARAVRPEAPGNPGAPQDAGAVIDTGMEYLPGDPVRVWVRHRDHRISVSDRGAALERAGAPRGWQRACARVHAELDVNITRAGAVWLPAVPVGPGEWEVAQRVARASMIFFQELLEMDGL
ncbi:MAG: hypothetical protein ACXVRX_10900 [Solirubrobacteraceae bacterium]